MKTVLRNMFLFFMLAVFLAGMNGFTFYVHECRSSQSRDIFAFPEIFNQHGSCGCDENTVKPAADPFLSFHEPDCCKSSFIYLKAKITGLPVFSQEVNPVLLIDLPADVRGLVSETLRNTVIKEIISFHHPPPLSGRELIHFLHQIKIPVSFS